MPRIELTDEIVKALTMTCPIKPTDSAELCGTHCALAGACMEYWTGDDSANRGEEENMKTFRVTVSDTATYEIVAETASEAKSIAWDWFNERKPAFEIEECENK